eukprot:1177263-Prorocentrum_minimum.AAC.5
MSENTAPMSETKSGACNQSDAVGAGIFSRRTNQTQSARVYSNDGPIRRSQRGYILTTNQSDAGS